MSENRWETLSGLYKTMRHTFGNDHVMAAQLAKILRNQLVESLGCDRDSVLLYDYDEKDHIYKPEEQPFQAVSMNSDYVWFVGYGITLEAAPNAYPKTTFQFPLWFHLEKDTTKVDTSFGTFSLPPGGQPDFTESCNAIYNGLKKSLHMRANKQSTEKQFGFVDFGD